MEHLGCWLVFKSMERFFPLCCNFHAGLGWLRESNFNLHLPLSPKLLRKGSPWCFTTPCHNTLKRWRPTRSSRCWKATALASEERASSSFSVLIILEGGWQGHTQSEPPLPQQADRHPPPP